MKIMKYIKISNIKYRAVHAILMIQILFFILCMAVISWQMAVHTAGRINEKKTERFASVKISSGESLWEISSRFYSDEYKNMHSYIKRIMKLNHMSDEEVCSGAYLIIPYYE